MRFVFRGQADCFGEAGSKVVALFVETKVPGTSPGTVFRPDGNNRVTALLGCRAFAGWSRGSLGGRRLGGRLLLLLLLHLLQALQHLRRNPRDPPRRPSGGAVEPLDLALLAQLRDEFALRAAANVSF